MLLVWQMEAYSVEVAVNSAVCASLPASYSFLGYLVIECRCGCSFICCLLSQDVHVSYVSTDLLRSTSCACIIGNVVQQRALVRLSVCAWCYFHWRMEQCLFIQVGCQLTICEGWKTATCVTLCKRFVS